MDKIHRLRNASAFLPLHHACNSTEFYYHPDIDQQALELAIGALPGTVARISPKCAAALYVIIANGMRAAEYLSAVVGNIVAVDRLLITPSKKSRSYIVTLPGLSQQALEASVKDPGIGVAGVYYMQLYRACCKCGIGQVLEAHKNLARTHAGRYNLTLSVLHHGAKVVTDVLRHRSVRSSSYYIDAIGGSHG